MIVLATIDGYSLHSVVGGVPVGDVALSRFDGLGSPAPRDDRSDRSRRHGVVDLTTYYGARVFELSGRVRGATEADVWDLVDAVKQKFALTGSSHTLRWQRAGRTYVERATVIVGSEFDYDDDVSGRSPFLWLGFTVQLVAADPRMYGDTLRTINFASSGNAQNDGNFNTQPTITFNGGGTNPGIRNNALSTENEIRTAVVLVGGDALVVDVAARSVTLNGVSRPDVIDAEATDFFGLVSGANSLTKLGGAVSIDVAWRDARI